VLAPIDGDNEETGAVSRVVHARGQVMPEFTSSRTEGSLQHLERAQQAGKLGGPADMPQLYERRDRRRRYYDEERSNRSDRAP